MNLRLQAQSDLKSILEDGENGFGWDIVLTNPAGDILNIVGFSNDISAIIDPDTGQAVSGRLASVALTISTILDAGFTMPQAIADTGSRPWIVQFNDINGLPHKFKIAQSNPDRAIGVLTCMLEAYK